ncbi:DUF3102 domain-containing protein, partial [Leptospira ellisii]
MKSNNNSIKSQKANAFLSHSKVRTALEPTQNLIELDIDETAENINKLVEGAENDFKNGMLKYIKAGELLIQQKEKMPYGEFTAWQEKNLKFSIPSASIYMKFAKYKEELIKSKEKTIRGARTLIKELEDATKPKSEVNDENSEKRLISKNESKIFYKKFLSGEKLTKLQKKTVKTYLNSEIERIKKRIDRFNDHLKK